MQSHKELYAVLAANAAAADPAARRVVCVSVAPQSRASIAAKYGLSTAQVRRRLAWLLKRHLGIDHLFDVAFARNIALLESAREFVRRYRAAAAEGTVPAPPISSPEPASGPASMPMLASACPGWICYAEKTHGAVLPLIDTTKSPQQIMGALVKDHLASSLGLTPDRIFHVAVMPCYDKKLEASRQDFYNDVYSTRDVDCVLTTGEVERMFREQGFAIGEAPEDDDDEDEDALFPHAGRAEGSSSGGYLSFILRYAARELFGVALSPDDVANGTNGVAVIPGRNPDSVDVTFTPPGADAPALRFAYSFGFRNIQNLVRKVKPGGARAANPRRTRAGGASAATSASTYHYVEVMACPSGCINGGGQLRPDAAPAATADPADQPPAPAAAGKAWIAAADKAYASPDEPIVLPDELPAVDSVVAAWLGSLGSDRARRLLHTAYRAVEAPAQSAASALTTKW
ncbi:Cytosolic Fe-S cluster assembly factor nar1 [Polyrhizophydium stewartii]|uniref:Cytosolic Fe-S cluster assembly factor nar1 n=1 Tax=Polyrhizophydium stewartii TaxID=2732419 RepID=A0ABR4NAN6_9FUNG